MPLPDFDHNHVLPPFINESPGNPANHSPYVCSINEFCEKFATTPTRIHLLKNFVKFRIKIHDSKITEGFQWVDGSFLENKEKALDQNPNDIDVATFFQVTSPDTEQKVKTDFPDFSHRKLAKDNYKLDHLLIHIPALNPYDLIRSTNFISKLFSYSRRGVFKGLVEIHLNTIDEDIAALEYLEKLAA
jgi:hypothetical protein